MKSEDFTIKKITEVNEKTISDVNRLLSEWSKNGYQISKEYFEMLVTNSHVLALYDENDIIGTVTLVSMHKLSGHKGSIEHLIVSEKYRGKGLGEKLMRHAVEYAKNLGMQKLCLTCEPGRVAANELYKKLGFKTKDTHFYQLTLHA